MWLLCCAVHASELVNDVIKNCQNLASFQDRLDNVSVFIPFSSSLAVSEDVFCFVMANLHLTKLLPQHSTDGKFKPSLHKISIKMLAAKLVMYAVQC
jgi:hypothetical protein